MESNPLHEMSPDITFEEKEKFFKNTYRNYLMNIIEKRMIDVLKKLSNEHGVFEIKAEFEAEASRMEELMRLKDVISAANLPLILKIGGVEAITDIYMGLSLGAHGIVAPMAETAFAR